MKNFQIYFIKSFNKNYNNIAQITPNRIAAATFHFHTFSKDFSQIFYSFCLFWADLFYIVTIPYVHNACTYMYLYAYAHKFKMEKSSLSHNQFWITQVVLWDRIKCFSFLSMPLEVICRGYCKDICRSENVNALM